MRLPNEARSVEFILHRTKVKLYRSVYLGEKPKEYRLILTVWIANDGIGSHECHGCSGFDVGPNFVDQWSIDLVTKSPEFVDVSCKLSALPKDVQEKLAHDVDTYAEGDALTDAMREIDAERDSWIE
jgi:hypothetical protein